MQCREPRWAGALLALPAILTLAMLLAVAAAAEDQPEGAEATSDFASEVPSEAGRRVERPGRTGLPLPRFASLRATIVNVRAGPGIRYPIDWVYTRRGLPVEIIDEFDTWRRIRDWEGTEGWVHQSMLQGRRQALVTGGERLLRVMPTADAQGVARLQSGVIGRLDRCEEAWCRLEVRGFSGWLRRDQFYGAYPGEPVD